MSPPPVQYEPEPEHRPDTFCAAPSERECATCRDMGFTLPAEFTRDPLSIPAGVLYPYGKPCQCRYGAWFSVQQGRWNDPAPERYTAPRLTARTTSEPWPTPAFADRPAPKLRRRVVMPTQEEIERIKAEQERSRKEKE